MAEVRHDADREERQQEEDDAKAVGFADRRRQFRQPRRRLRQGERQSPTAKVAMKPRMNFGNRAQISPTRASVARRGIDVVGPDIGEDERPDADEDVDEHFHGRRNADDPAGLISDPSAAFCAWMSDCVMPPAASAAPSVFTARPSHAAATSGSCDNEGLRDARQDQNFDHGENDDERGHEHRHLRSRADGAAGGDRRGDAADRNAGSERRRPFAAEAEPLRAMK